MVVVGGVSPTSPPPHPSSEAPGDLNSQAWCPPQWAEVLCEVTSLRHLLSWLL